MSIEIENHTGMALALTETVDGCTFPADYSFRTVNDFVHRVDTGFEDLQALCLGMAAQLDKLTAEREELNRIAGGR